MAQRAMRCPKAGVTQLQLPNHAHICARYVQGCNAARERATASQLKELIDRRRAARTHAESTA